MAASGLGSLEGELLAKLSPQDRAEIHAFAQQESGRERIQNTVHALTDMCFTKCVTGKISAGKLDRTEEPCMRNCVERFFDANMAVVKKLEGMRM